MNNCVREIGRDGNVRTLYGARPVPGKLHGEAGFCDGYANLARFNRPWGLCLRAMETEIIVVDSHNSSLRKITRDTEYVETIRLEQDMSKDISDVVQQPSQLLYPSEIRMGSTGDDVFVVNSSSHEIMRIDLTRMLFRAVPFYFGVADTFRPAGLNITSGGNFIVGYTGYDVTNCLEDTKLVSFQGLQLFRKERRPIYYRHLSRVEITQCLTFSLAVDKSKMDASVWITDCGVDSRLLRVCLQLRWSFFRVLLLAVRKPVPGSVFSMLPMCVHNSRSSCPILLHIVKLLQGVCAFH